MTTIQKPSGVETAEQRRQLQWSINQAVLYTRSFGGGGESQPASHYTEATVWEQTTAALLEFSISSRGTGLLSRN